MRIISPYHEISKDKWSDITLTLLGEYPLKKEEMIEVTLSAWKNIFHSGIGEEKFQIGKDIFPEPQIMGYLLHELIPLKLHTRYPKIWKKDYEVSEKDIVYIPDISYSMEIKTSSHPNRIFGNRSYAQPATDTKKDKSGYYLAINFEKFSEHKSPRILLIRFGWLDYTDWIGQAAATGQQAHLTLDAERKKLVEIYKL